QSRFCRVHRKNHCLVCHSVHVNGSQLARWGNSLALRIPKRVIEEANLQEGDAVEVNASGPGEIELRVVRSAPTLAELTKRITPENAHKETDWGQPVGKEIW